MLGFGIIVSAASTNTILQTIADEDKRARVISIYVMIFLGMGPIGNFIAGSLAEWVGARWTLVAYGLLLTLAAGLFARGYASWRRAMHPVYVRHGVIPEGER